MLLQNKRRLEALLCSLLQHQGPLPDEAAGPGGAAGGVAALGGGQGGAGPRAAGGRYSGWVGGGGRVGGQRLPSAVHYTLVLWRRCRKSCWLLDILWYKSHCQLAAELLVVCGPF